MADSSTIDNPLRTPAVDSAATGLDFDQLDNPIWNALRSEHAELAQGDGLARRYPAAIGPLSGMAEPNAEGYEALRSLAGPGGVVALFLKQPATPPAGWTWVRDGRMNQMIYLPRNAPQPQAAPLGVEIVELTAADAPAMVELAEFTEPGPFHLRTMELGMFFGIKESGRLLAMAGERMRWTKFVEVSAVCTHPEARGRGYGSALIAKVIAHVLQIGKTPMLHVFTANLPAIRVYENLGFVLRRHLELAVLKNEA
ncbi:MAG: GNAT family N-acetyltransferase [Terracidiphilus sp.]